MAGTTEKVFSQFATLNNTLALSATVTFAKLGFTQFTDVNILDTLLVQGSIVTTVDGDFDITGLWNFEGPMGIGTITPNSQLQVEGSFSVKRLASADSVSSSDEVIIAITDTSAARTVTISSADIVAGRIFIIKDEGGNAGSFNITITTEGPQNIDGSLLDITIMADHGSMRLYASDSDNLWTW